MTALSSPVGQETIETGLGAAAARGGKWVVAQQLGQHLVQFLVLLVLARMLPPEAFGLVALASVFVALVQVFVDQGLGEALVYESSVDQTKLDSCFWLAILGGVVALVLSVLGAGPISRVFAEPSLKQIIPWLAIVFLPGAMTSVPSALLRRGLRFRPLAMAGLAGSLTGGIAAVIAAASGFGVMSLVVKSVVGSTVHMILTWKASGWLPGLRVELREWSRLLRFGGSIIGSRFLSVVNRRLDDLLIGYFLGPIALGYYFIAYRVVLLATTTITSPIGSVMFPAFTRMRSEPDRLMSAVKRAVATVAVIAVPVFSGLAITAAPVLGALFGDHWQASVPVMQVLCLIGVLHALMAPLDALFPALGCPGLRLRLMLVNTAGNVVAFLIAVHWGIVAVAVAYVIRGYLLTPLSFLWLRRLVEFRPRTMMRLVAPSLCAALVMVFVLFALRSTLLAMPSELGLVTQIVVGAGVYTFSLRLLSISLFQQTVQILRVALGFNR